MLAVGCFQPEADYNGQTWRNVFIGLTDDIKHAHTSNNRGHGFGSGRSVLLLKAAIAESVKFGYKIRNVLSSQISYKLVSPDKSKSLLPADCKLIDCSAHTCLIYHWVVFNQKPKQLCWHISSYPDIVFTLTANAECHLDLIAAAGCHPNADEASDVPPSSQHPTGAALAVAGAGCSDVQHHITTNSAHTRCEPQGDAQGLDMSSNECDAQSRDKRKGTAMDSAAVGSAQKKQKSVRDAQARMTQINEPLNQQGGGRSSETQSPRQCPPTAVQSADSDVARGCIALLALHRTTAEGMSIDSGDTDLVGGLMQTFCTLERFLEKTLKKSLL